MEQLSPMHHNYRVCVLHKLHNCRVCELKLMYLEPVLHNKRSHCIEKPVHHNRVAPTH